jgi:hypothetical protein
MNFAQMLAGGLDEPRQARGMGPSSSWPRIEDFESRRAERRAGGLGRAAAHEQLGGEVAGSAGRHGRHDRVGYAGKRPSIHRHHAVGAQMHHELTGGDGKAQVGLPQPHVFLAKGVALHRAGRLDVLPPGDAERAPAVGEGQRGQGAVAAAIPGSSRPRRAWPRRSQAGARPWPARSAHGRLRSGWG